MGAPTQTTNGHSHLADRYAPGEDRPLGGYAALTAGFGAVFAGAIAALRASGRAPDRLGAADIVLGGIATHKLTRLISEDRVTRFLRAPFTRYEGPKGQGEVAEEPRGTGLQLAVGELVVCPYCLAQWVAAGIGLGYVAAPRTTRFLAGVYTIEAISDALQLAYGRAKG